MSNLNRIVEFLREEGIPKTPHEISIWTGIKLEEVYETLQENKIMFTQILDKGYLKGWIVSSGYY